jgi:dolichol-phosphate mannosyltransferase
MSLDHPSVSIIVPAYREAANLSTLVERIFAAVRGAGIEAELIIVDDDSQDGTQETVERLSAEYPVRLIVRRNARGLSGAVLAGFASARGERWVVMDADLQHPPETIPAMLQHLADDRCEFVLASRYVSGGGLARDWSASRRWGSRMATWLARPLVSVSDPMSGFFALRRRVWERAGSLDPFGYKIALELMVKSGCGRPAEVPFQFATRHAGESKAGAAEMIRYLRLLGRLYWLRHPGWIVAFAVLAGLLGLALFGWAFRKPA